MILDMAVFTTLNILLIRHIHPGVSDLIAFITPMHVFILALAVYRGANVISNEFITTPLRAYFVKETVVGGHHVEEPYDQGFRGFAGSLLYCPSCTGVWIAAIITYSYILWPGPTSIVTVVLALSALERVIADILGRIKAK